MALQEERNRYNALGQATNRLFTTGSIAFQALRDSFKNETVQAGAVKASELVRYTSKDIDEPIVPDCVENEEAGIASEKDNLKASTFRNSIKDYNITVTSDTGSGTIDGLNYDFGSLSWNNNLVRNIKKLLTVVSGQFGSNDTNNAAAKVAEETHNLSITLEDVKIYGAGGAGATPEISSQRGGTALSLQSPGGDKINLNVTTDTRLWGGGGGGDVGEIGESVAAKNCPYGPFAVQTPLAGQAGGGPRPGTGCRSTPLARMQANNPGYTVSPSSCQGCSRPGRCWRYTFSQNSKQTQQQSQQSGTNPHGPAVGGLGGSGGYGVGYNNPAPSGYIDFITNGAGKGADGDEGDVIPAPCSPLIADPGKPGGNGGNWGRDGDDKIGGGGAGGFSISGNYTLQSDLRTNDTIWKGPKSPLST